MILPGCDTKLYFFSIGGTEASAHVGEPRRHTVYVDTCNSLPHANAI